MGGPFDVRGGKMGCDSECGAICKLIAQNGLTSFWVHIIIKEPSLSCVGLC